MEEDNPFRNISGSMQSGTPFFQQRRPDADVGMVIEDSAGEEEEDIMEEDEVSAEELRMFEKQHEDGSWGEKM